jgi:ribosomal protein RSM22 (predicted rRNA methylase)
MRLPDELSEAVEAYLSTLPGKELKEAVSDLSSRYRDKSRLDQSPKLSEIQRAAYILARLPATYAAVRQSLGQLSTYSDSINTLLDIGAGPGTVMWASSELSVRIVNLERQRGFIELGQRLAQHSSNEEIREAEWIEAGVEELPVRKFDLVTASYLLGELSHNSRLKLLKAAWDCAAQFLLLIEPGTPLGYSNIVQARDELLKSGANIVAPCPHKSLCPMTGSNWCHFSARVERSSSHRRAKGGTLAFEDEKFSYILLSKQSVPTPSARIIRHPYRKAGHIHLELCTTEGLKRSTLSQKDKDQYRMAKKAYWGDDWNF